MVLYEASETNTEKPSNSNFCLHTHDDYEIYLFLKGDTKYIVEEKVYTLSPGDVIVIRKHEMHRAFHNSPSPYHRFVLMISPEFFQEYDCAKYEAQFTNTGIDNKISSEIVRSGGLYDAFMRLKKYSKNFSETDTPVCASVIVEILYLINNIRSFEVSDTSHGQLKAVIAFLNSHYTETIALDELEKNFFISKYHLCRLFRQNTGLTIHQYLIRKRLALAKELITNGKSLSEAASLAGFSDYSSFYRAYKKEYGHQPRLESKIK